MEKPFLPLLYIGFVLLDAVGGFPVQNSSVSTGILSPVWLTSYFATAFGLLLTTIAIIFGCVCCRNGKGFKEFSNSSGSLATTRTEGFVNPTANAELTIFPPGGPNSGQLCRLEPLPDFKPQTPNLRPAAFSSSEREISSQDWFSEPYSNFPRNQLKYVEEYGRGWFGRVVSGEAQNIAPKEKLTKVMVKILHADATPTDQMYFLHEVKFYKDLKHPNILRLLGRCLETEPFLIILECYPNGDLKTFLSQNLASARALVEQGATLQMCSNITSGLSHMHKNKFIHTDLAARNCLVAPDLTVKIGDYGNSIENFKSDYYCAGSVALPIRWCAPETLKCTDVTIETREVTPPANIWSLAIVFWEICEFCKLPYSELNDDQVIVRVLGDKNYFLEKPNMFCLYKDELYHLMKLCWNPPLQRPTAAQLQVILDNLISSGGKIDRGVDPRRVSQDFEQRWQNLKPNYIPKKDDAGGDTDQNSGCIGLSSMLKNAKVMDSSLVDSPLGVFMSNKNSGQESPRFCLKSDREKLNEKTKDGDIESVRKENGVEGDVLSGREKGDFDLNGETRVPDALNLNEKFKSADADVDSWLKGVEIRNEEDENFVRKISEAIRDLDAALALEKTSSSEEESARSSHQSSPGKEAKEAVVSVDFKLGSDVPTVMNLKQKSFELSSLQNSQQPQSLNFKDTYLGEVEKGELDAESVDKDDSLFMGGNFDVKNYGFDESLRENDSFVGNQSRHSSDTDDEVWRKRIEKGEISEKVKEKSKSIANLMILTHIDASDDSDTDLDVARPADKNLNRSSFFRRSGSFAKNSLTSNIFGSENDLTNAVLEDEFRESLKKLSNDHKEYGRFDSLGMILPTFAGRENVWENLLRNSSPPSEETVGHSADGPKMPDDMDKDEAIKSSVIFVGEIESKEEQINPENNFLGNVASEKSIDSGKLVAGAPGSDEKGENISLDMEKSATSDYFSEKEDTLVHLKCDNACSTDSSNSSSKRNSSQLNDEVSEEEGLEGNLSFEANEREDSGNVRGSKNEGPPDKKPGEDFLSGEMNENDLTPEPEEREQLFGNGEMFRAVQPVEKNEKALEGAGKFPEIQVAEPSGSFVSKEKLGFVPDIVVTEEEPGEIGSPEPEESISLYFERKPFKFIMKNEEEEAEEETDENFFEFDDSLNCFKEENFLGEKNGKTTDRFFDMGMVIMGPSEEFTLDYFVGLKTTSNEIGGDWENNEKDYWNRHLENALDEQVTGKDFDDITFESLCYDSLQSISVKPEISCPSETITNFIESEKIHTEKSLNDLYDLNSLPGNEEEYENLKFRTPDDERSSDSGFRDKGSLSESVEDACEGSKYNLEDIEAELEGAYAKGAFGNVEEDAGDKCPGKSLENPNNFEYEESKFYEEENKNNEDNFSDIDGEIEFWQNKEGSDYYPEISEFNPTCSQGWYLHPPDENSLTYSRNVNEDLMNAIRNELRENLPVQTRSFAEFNDEFYEPAFMEDPKRELNIHYAVDLSMPLSPIIEEHDPCSETSRKNLKNFILEGATTPRRPVSMSRNMANLMESVKSIDTNTFMQYLDYMVENEGKGLEDLDELEDEADQESSTTLTSARARNLEEQNGPNKTEENDWNSPGKDGKQFIADELFLDAERLKGSAVEGNEGLFSHDTPFSTDRERSLSDLSRIRWRDALSENSLSSRDQASDCFSSNAGQNPERVEISDSFCKGETAADKKESATSSDYHLASALEPKTQNEVLPVMVSLDCANDEEDPSDYTDPSGTETKFCSAVEEIDSYEMSTSFMEGCDGDDGSGDAEKDLRGEKKDDFEDFDVSECKQEDDASGKDTEDAFFTAEWDSEDSSVMEEEEETSSSSGEFIWKDGDTVSKVKVVQANCDDVEDAVFEDSLIDKGTTSKDACNAQGEDKDGRKEIESEDEEEEDDNESSTGSSASITDFVPSAWNSQAVPGRSVLRSANEEIDSSSLAVKKKNVCFKKQKYHCVYEYPREPSDSEDADAFNQMSSLDNSPKHFSFELPNKHFPFGLSNVVDYSGYDWDVLKRSERDLVADSDAGLEKSAGNPPAKDGDFDFYALNPFDYDFNGTENPGSESEFLVSSSSRPFQTGSTFSVFPGNNRTNQEKNNDSGESDETSESKGFATPDSGLEDSLDNNNASSVERRPESGNPGNSILLKMKDLTERKGDNNLKSDFAAEDETEKSKGDESGGTGNGSEHHERFSLSPGNGLGELRHARDRLKLDLPFNHNAELGAMRSKKVNRIH